MDFEDDIGGGPRAPITHLMFDDLTRQLSEAREEIARLRKALEKALFSMEQLCFYTEDHKDEIELAKAALEASDG